MKTHSGNRLRLYETIQTLGEYDSRSLPLDKNVKKTFRFKVLVETVLLFFFTALDDSNLRKKKLL